MKINGKRDHFNNCRDEASRFSFARARTNCNKVKSAKYKFKPKEGYRIEGWLARGQPRNFWQNNKGNPNKPNVTPANLKIDSDFGLFKNLCGGILDMENQSSTTDFNYDKTDVGIDRRNTGEEK